MSVELISKFQSAQPGLGSVRETDSIRIDSASETGATENGAVTFGDFLKSAITETNDLQLQSNGAVEELIAGRNKDIHGTMLALEKADVSLRLLTQVRNKVIDAYREVMKMKI